MKRFFITGTDTDSGKTYSTCALLDYLGSQAVAVKPVASGCIDTPEGLVSEDALAIQQHTNPDLPDINPWRFAAPVSPHIASRHNPLSLEAIADYCLNFSSQTAEILFIEGAGGLMVPLTDTEFWTDFLKRTQIPVILVVGIRTGCINHALLTQIALHFHQIPLAGWIANQIDPQVLAWDDNIATLRSHIKAPLMGIIRHGKHFEALLPKTWWK